MSAVSTALETCKPKFVLTVDATLVYSESALSMSGVASEFTDTNIDFVPAVKFTGEVPFEPPRTVVRVSVLPADAYVPIPSSHAVADCRIV
jgi:hypothetical protein